MKEPTVGEKRFTGRKEGEKGKVLAGEKRKERGKRK